MSFCGCWNKIWIGVMVFSAVVCGTLTHMSIRSGRLVMEFFLWWSKIVLSQILNSVIQINCCSFWKEVRDRPFKTSVFDHYPLLSAVFLLLSVGKFGRILTPHPLKKTEVLNGWSLMLSWQKLDKILSKFSKKRKKQKVFSQTDIL